MFWALKLATCWVNYGRNILFAPMYLTSSYSPHSTEHMMAFLKLTTCRRKFKSVAVSIMALINKFLCRYSITTGVVVIGTSYVIMDLLRLFYHLTIFYFPGPIFRHWYFEDRSGDEVHDLITVTMMKNRIQVLLVLGIDLLTDIGLLMSVNSGVITIGIWLLKAIIFILVYLVVILSLVFAYSDHITLALVFIPILVMEIYFLLIVGLHLVNLREPRDTNEESPDETVV
ncbi:uncharacterized protein LOC26536141 [Drosophila yakuba]|uniref:Uncharacterized protein n=1 Tax=Drosophila yakuba TaxID=7245 RepID=A0A0R1DPW7_DROYA|nr:uncharacterized protein LOC26536141 [Drosophila yakuba]KRJ99323.1 uncharacterized protein Dyak_GE28960 [Drosophila yakuba]